MECQLWIKEFWIKFWGHDEGSGLIRATQCGQWVGRVWGHGAEARRANNLGFRQELRGCPFVVTQSGALILVLGQADLLYEELLPQGRVGVLSGNIMQTVLEFLRSFWEEQQVPSDEELRVHPQLETELRGTAAPGWGGRNRELDPARCMETKCERQRELGCHFLRITQAPGSSVPEVVSQRPQEPGKSPGNQTMDP